jgi:hypothetical protein
MTLPQRPALVLAAVVLMSLSTGGSFGFFSPAAFAGAVLALALALAACLRAGPEPSPAGSAAAETALAAAALFLAGWVAGGYGLDRLLSGRSELFYPDVGRAEALLPWAELAGFAAVALAALAPRTVWRPGGRWPILLGLVVLTGTLLRVLPIVASPDPVIDVYAWLRDAPGNLLHGKNPYATDIESPYGTPRAAEYGVPLPPDPRPAAYPPLPILLALPFRAVGLDVRLANVAGDLAAAVALVGVARFRGRVRLGVLAAALYLHLPRVPFLIEQAWYEPMLAGLLGAGLCLGEREGRAKWAGHVLLGLGLTGKQYGVAPLVPLAWAERRRWQPLAFGLAVAALVSLPFFLWSPHDFLSVVLGKHLARPTQYGSITLTSAAVELFDREPPRAVMWAVAGVLIAAVAVRGPQRGAAVGLGMGTALAVFCLFHTQGYLNYFYLCEFCWLVGFVGLQPPAAAPAKP